MLSTIPVSGETVQFVSDDATIRAYLARPTDRPGRLPAVIILHEWWGLNEQIVGVANRFAREGFVALAVDLYSRQGYKVTQDPNEAADLMNNLSSQRALRDLNAAVIWLKQLPHVDPPRIGMVGFSMGGILALTVATHNSDVKAVVVFYGKVPPIETLESLLAPLQFHYAGKDGWVTRQEVDRLAQGFQQFNKPGEILTYPNADHSFFNEKREVYRQEEALQAWQKTLRFFSQYLR